MSQTFLVVDLAGTFAFALNGAWTAMRVANLDIVGVLVLGVLTAQGGGFLRDVMLGELPPATFRDWRYLAVAASASLLAFATGQLLDRLSGPITVFDAAGLSLFAVSGALKGLEADIGVAQAVIVGVLTAVGGGTLRDVLTREVPAVLTSGLYAIPAFLGALVVVAGAELGAPTLGVGILAAAVCFAVRMLGVHYDVDAPRPPGARRGA